MHFLLQAATMPHDAVDWRTVATLAIGAYLGLKTWIDNQREAERIREATKRENAEKDLRKKVDDHAQIITEIVTQIGIRHGGGMAAQMESVVEELKGLREDVHKAMLAMAKGAR